MRLPVTRPVSRSGILRGVLRGVLLALAVGAAVLGWPVPAQAHAQLERTIPAAGAELAVAPPSVQLFFAEGVRPVPGGLRVLSEDGSRVDDAQPTASGGTITLALPSLPKGAYVVAWRVVSADGHPVRGAFTFRVGGRGDQSVVGMLAAKLLVNGATRSDVSGAAALFRALSLAAVAVLLGGAFHLLFVSADPVARGRATIGTALGVAALSGIGSVLLYGPLVTGQSIGGIVHLSLLKDTLADRVGQALIIRTLLLVLLGIVVLHWRRDRSWLSVHGAVIGALGVAVGFAQAFTGHGGTGRALAFALPSTVVHVLAMGAWAGGLVFVFLTLRASTASSTKLTVTRRFSRNAGVAVGALVASGSFAMWRQVGSLDAARSTPSGRLLLVKLAVVAGLLLLGARNRRSLAAGNTMAIRRTIAVEIVGVAAVLVLTALVVSLPPARDVVARPLSVSVTTQTGLVDITVDPAKRGRNELHIYALTKDGAVRPIESISATLSNPVAGIDSLDTPVVRAGPNHFQALALDIPLGGTWRIDVAIKLDAFTEETGSATFTLR